MTEHPALEDELDWLDRHSEWARFGAIAAMFTAAPAVGYLLALVAGPGSDFAVAAGAIALLLTLGLGYALWSSYTKAVLVHGVFGGLIGAGLRFLFSRDRKDLESAKKSLAEAFTDRERALEISRKIRGKAAVFLWLGLGFGLCAGLVVAIAGSALGFGATLGLYGASGALYGFVLSRLGRAGYILMLE
ncbi:MAG: hypothetical protein QNJ30_21965 [Kiloniellales bacterium]|nr:hypothetical protein [Kiloniellales bacterium]